MLNQAAPLPSKIKLEKGGKLSIIIEEKRNRYYLSFGNILKEELIGFHNEPYWVAFGLSIYPILTGNGKKKFKSKEIKTIEKMITLFSAYISGTIYTLFTSLIHIGPLRQRPSRVYSGKGFLPLSVGEDGRWTIDILQMNIDLIKVVKTWLKRFNISLDFKLDELRKNSNRYEVMLEDPFLKTKVNLLDVGFGVSQILPIIVQGYYAENNAVLLIEEPEIHLHPKAQCTMGDMFVDIVNNSEKKLIIETHSDLLIERVCKHILYKDENKRLSPEDILIYYFEPTEDGTKIRKITVDKNGQYENFPEGFFEERFKEALDRAELMEEEAIKGKKEK